MASSAPTQFTAAPTIVLVADLTGYASGFRSHSDAEMAAFLDRFYRMIDDVIEKHGGRVIKFMGDAVLSTFPPEDATDAVAAAVEMQHHAGYLAEDVRLDVRLGANIHLGDAVAGELGSGKSRRPDVIGRTVNQTFLLGRGGGIRISERVYRKLPSGDRTGWEKRRPPVVYVFGDSDEAYSALGKTPSENALRW